MTEIDIKGLIEKADAARKNSYVPYSHFAVGAALLLKDGRIITGSNIENASYGGTVCAERCAIFKAASEGHREFEAIAIAGSPEGEEISRYAYPCGMCRQVMREFVNPGEFKIIVAGAGDAYIEKTLEELLPESFGPEALITAPKD